MRLGPGVPHPVAVATQTELKLAARSADPPARVRREAMADAILAEPDVVRAAPVKLDPMLTAEDALERIGHSCLDHAFRNEPAILGGQPEAVHQMRVAIRRLRAAISAFRKMLPEDQHRWVSSELRQLADMLGEARNLDVFKSELLDPAKAAMAGNADIGFLERTVERRRRAAYSAIRQVLRSPDHAKLMSRLLDWFDGREWRQSPVPAGLQRPVGEIAPAMLDRRRRMVERRRKGFARQSPEQQHRLRIALKKMRYTADLFSGLYPARRTAEFGSLLKRLQDDLGSANDLYIGERLIEDLARHRTRGRQIAAAGKQLLEWHDDRLQKQQRKIRADLRRFRQSRAFWRE